MRRRKTPYLGPFANGFANALANRALDRLRYVHHRFHAEDGRGPFGVSYQASAIQRVAATVSGSQTKTSKATTGIGLFL